MAKFFIPFVLIFLCKDRVCFGQSNAISLYTSYLKNQKQSAKDYIVGLFKDHDIVIICERQHNEMTQYDLLADVISDKRFIDNVGNVFTEVGLSTLNPALNRFLHTKNLPADTVENRVIDFQRNCSFWPIWVNKNYYQFLQTLYSINNRLPEKEAINVYPSDLPFTWAGADSSSMLDLKVMLGARDSIMASQIITQFNQIKASTQKRKKALVVMNYRHAFQPEFFIRGRSLKNTAYFLFKEYGDRTANVLLNTLGTTADGNYALLQEGKWDAAFKHLDIENAGFSFKDSPFGVDSFDLWPYKTEFAYQDVFTGFAFYQPIEKHHSIEGYQKLIEPRFCKEVMNRMDLICIVGGEFKKMADLKKRLEQNNELLNTEEDRKYYQIDSLTNKRDAWLK